MIRKGFEPPQIKMQPPDNEGTTTPPTMSFEESMTAFYMALAEQRLEAAALALGGMRQAVAGPEAALREEVRGVTRRGVPTSED